MFPVAIPVRLRAKKLRKTVALRGKVGGANSFGSAFASRPQCSNVREFVSEVQTKISNWPRRRRGAEKRFVSTDSHG